MNFMNSKKLLVTVICAAWACSCFGQNTSSSDQDIPPAVAKQLQAMQAKIDELEQELRNRPAQPQSAVPDGDGNAAHTLAEQNSGAPLPQVTAEKTAEPNPNQKPEPFSFADFSWLNGNSRVTETPFATKFFTPEIRADVDYVYDFAHPPDDTIGGSSEIFRHERVPGNAAGHRRRLPLRQRARARHDAVRHVFADHAAQRCQSGARPVAPCGCLPLRLRGVRRVSPQWLDGINVEAGIFMSYIGLFSYYNFDNWAYQPSYVSANTPWFFNGVRVADLPERTPEDRALDHQRLAVLRQVQQRPGLGGQILWRPNG